MMIPQIVKHVVLFPLLLPVWQERPLGEADLIPGPYPPQVTEHELALQRDALSWADPHLRGRIAVSLGDMGRRDAARILLAQLGREGDPAVLVTVLTQLSRSPLTDLDVVEAATPLLSAEEPGVRIRALGLMSSVPECDVPAIARVALEDPVTAVRLRAWEALVRLAPRLELSFLRRHWRDADPSVRALALTAGCSKPEVGAFALEVTAACDDPSPLVRLALARALGGLPGPLSKAIAARLAKDPHASVRAECMAVLPALPAREASASLLAGAVEDADPEVRRLACEGLALFPSQACLEKLVGRFGDPMRLVREQAGRSVVAVHRTVSAAAIVHGCLASEHADVRVQACRSLGSMGIKSSASALAELLESETRAENTAAAVYGLGSLRFIPAATAVARRATHADAGVRAEVGRALGRFAQPETYGVIGELAFDEAEAVRQQALFGIRESGDGRLSPVLLKVLKTTAEGAVITAQDRVLACWSAAVLRPVSRALMERLVEQATTPVVPVMGGKEFEQDFVLVSACWALASCARDDEATRPLAATTCTAHGRLFSETDAGNPAEGIYAFSAEVGEYARQARAFMEGKPAEPRPRPTSSPRLCIRPLPPSDTPE